ncbi:MAG: 2-amino-4-hydroxy-6-hydroxymethyldihydropteridine diphosphokinase [Legionellaceae bacterium]|nr:2-amino-4-hydroxy-6-hydroxymethyldihydropteridine diphosphokinase [Legionellaceae bacterium]
MSLCYLGLGSNLKSPKRQLNQAIATLRTLPKSIIIDISTVYFNPPIGVRAQPMFYNLVIALQTSLPPAHLLNFCKKIEQKQRRICKKKWGPRTIDIDILLYGNQIIQTPSLTIPHPEMLQRDFVLIPLLELSPEISLPNGIELNTYMK